MKRFGAYEILHELKSGGMGSVLLARRRGPGAFEQLVAIKTIRAEFAGTPAVRAMFLDEAAILARINHPGIATVHDFGEEGGTLYMVMEYVAGIPFRDLIEHQPPATVIARAVAEACRGLHAAHELRDLAGNPLDLVHRDISPDNLMLGFDGHVKVIDFGIALVKKNRQAPVTEFGMVKGKPPYMSPEQVANEPMDRRSDIFSLGVVLWELLTQRTLFQGDSIYAVAIAVQQQPIQPPSQVRGNPLPLGLDAAVMNALDRDPRRRTPTAAAFAEQIEQVLQQAAGETLEAWAERALARARDDHRAWLASVIGGTNLPRVIGRATGQVTEVAPLGQADTQAAPLTGPPPAQEMRAAVAPVISDDQPGEHAAPTSIGGTSLDNLSIPPTRKLGALVVLLLALLTVAGGIYMATRKRDVTALVPDAAMRAADAHVADAEAPIPVLDAYVPPVDARVTVDAAVRVVTVRPDAGRRERPDAAVVRVRPDAAVVAPPPPSTGKGTITIKYKPGPYANISIDGGAPIPGPIFRKRIAAGTHTITFHDPRTGETLDTQTIEVEDGEAETVVQR